MSNDLNQLPVKQMHDVDWDKVTERQAVGFGLALALFNDAIEQHTLARSVFLAHVSSSVVAVVLAGVLLLLWTSPSVAIVAVAVVLSLNAATSWWQSCKVRKKIDQATESLKANVALLPHVGDCYHTVERVETDEEW